MCNEAAIHKNKPGTITMMRGKCECWWTIKQQSHGRRGREEAETDLVEFEEKVIPKGPRGKFFASKWSILKLLRE